MSFLFAKEGFVAEVEEIFSSPKDRKPLSLGITMGHGLSTFSSLEVDVKLIFPPANRPWSLAEVEFVLGVLASRQTPNVKETKLSFYADELGDISAEVWKLLSKLNNLTYLNIAWNKLRVVSPLASFTSKNSN